MFPPPPLPLAYLHKYSKEKSLGISSLRLLNYIVAVCRSAKEQRHDFYMFYMFTSSSETPSIRAIMAFLALCLQSSVKADALIGPSACFEEDAGGGLTGA